MAAYWLFGSSAIGWIIVMEAGGSRYAVMAYAAYGAILLPATYVLLALMINRTTVAVRSGSLIAHSGPLPFAKPLVISVRDVSDVVVGSQMTHGYKGAPAGRIYTVLARTVDGATLPIVSCAIIGAGERADAQELARRIQAMCKGQVLENAIIND